MSYGEAIRTSHQINLRFPVVFNINLSRKSDRNENNTGWTSVLVSRYHDCSYYYFMCLYTISFEFQTQDAS